MSTPADFSVLNSSSNFLTSCADISNKEAGIVDFFYMPYTGMIFRMINFMIDDCIVIS